MKSFLDIYVTNLGYGHKVHVIGLDNTVIATVHHIPWFTLYAPAKLPRTDEVEPVEGGVPLIYNSNFFSYIPDSMHTYIVRAPSRDRVPRLASLYKSKVNGRAGLFNIRYEVRVSYDLQRQGYRLLGLPTLAVFLPNDEMIDVMEKTIDRLRTMKVLAVDIEVYSTRGGFPEKGDPILSITYAVFRLGDDIFSPDWPENNVKTIILDRVSSASRMRIESRKLVSEFFRVLERERPNIIVTYNGSAFDFPYMEPYKARDQYLLEPFFLGVWREDTRIVIPHVDLMLLRESLGSSLGVRSQVAHALEDVALEVAESISKYCDVSWLAGSKYITAERVLNHAKLRDYWERDDPLFHTYIVADVYLTALLARIWLYPVFVLAVLTGTPVSILQRLNMGQLAEYVAVEFLTRLGFYPELREREFDYAKTSARVSIEDSWVFNRGKVYTLDYGVYGGRDKMIIELDFAQLYPTDMVSNTVDPTSIYIVKGYRGSTPLNPTLATSLPLRIVAEKQTSVLLGKRKKKSEATIEPFYVMRVVPGYGPISWLVYKLYTARRETKKLKSRAKEEKKPELAAPDQAIKILNNSFYGAMSKRRGNLVNELASASVFWRTQKLLYEVIDFVNKELPKRIGKPARALYGDTDSVYIEVPRDVDPKRVAEEVNKWIKQRYGSLYEMELEGVYDLMVIPRQKAANQPSAKSYMCFAGGKPVKVKGEFFKVIAPLAIKERLLEFYTEVIKRGPRTREEVRSIVREFLESEPIHKWFVRKSISSFTSEDDPRKLKRLNKDFHYAALYSLLMYRSPGVAVVDTNAQDIVSYFGGKYRVWRFRVDPRAVERSQRAVVVLYLPTGNPRRFIVYESDDGESALVHFVEVVDVRVETEGASEQDAVETYYLVTVRARRVELPRNLLLKHVLHATDKTLVDMVYRKLIPALRKREQGVLA